MPKLKVNSIDDMTQAIHRILTLRLPVGYTARIQDGDLVIETERQVFIYLARTVTRG